MCGVNRKNVISLGLHLRGKPSLLYEEVGCVTGQVLCVAICVVCKHQFPTSAPL